MTDQQDTLRGEDAPQPVTRVFDSKKLFADQDKVVIRHEDKFYRLLKT